MVEVNADLMLLKKRTYSNMDTEFSSVRTDFMELAEYTLPRRYRYLNEGRQRNTGKGRNKKILDGVATRAVRTLSAGLLFSLASPLRPWLKFEMKNDSLRAKQWASETAFAIQAAMARSNFYGTLGENYNDLSVFGTSPMLIYEDQRNHFRCYTSPCGEYRWMKDARNTIGYFSRTLMMTSDQLVNRFGFENCSDQVQRDFQHTTTGSNKFNEYAIYHLIEPNDGQENFPADLTYREYYWEKSQNERMLSISGFREKPFTAPRWEVVGNDTYGVSPAMDALGDIIQLQHLVMRRAKSIDKMESPPIVADQTLRNSPSALMPNGVTFVPSATQVGAKPLYLLNPPLNEMLALEGQKKQDINEFFYNDLFRAILNLQTVRSATEVIERTEEKLALLGLVVHRLEHELLNDAVLRIYSILARRGELPEPPPEVEDDQIELKYNTILHGAIRAAGIGNLERYLSTAGQLVSLAPDTYDVTDWHELLRNYADILEIDPNNLQTRDYVEEQAAIRRDLEQQREQAEIQQLLSQSSANLADADVPAGVV